MSSKSDVNSNPMWMTLKQPLPVSELLYVAPSFQARVFVKKMNDTQFLAHLGTKSLEAYDAVHDEWSRIQLSIGNEIGQWQIVWYDEASKVMYLTVSDRIITVNLETGCNTILHSQLPFSVQKAILIGDDLHVFGVNVHLVLRAGCKTKDYYDMPQSPQMVPDCELVLHCESRDSILLFRNGAYPSFNRDFAEFSLSSKKWKRLKVPSSSANGNMVGVAMMCSADGRYIICFGGLVRDPPVARSIRESFGYISKDVITVYDLSDVNDQTLKPKRCQLLCPVKGRFHALTMTDKKKEEMATFGFVRQCFESKQLKEVNFPPHYIIQMISKWVEMEYVYLLKNGNGGGHWKISLKDILESVV